MKRFAIASVLLSLVTMLGNERVYSDSFHKHYPLRGREFDLSRHELEAPVEVWHDLRRRKVTVLRTRGDKYPYEDQKAVITIEGRGLEMPKALSASDFRTVDVSWITEKLIFIRVGIGHVAAVETIYDVEKDSWLYRESVH